MVVGKGSPGHDLTAHKIVFSSSSCSILQVSKFLLRESSVPLFLFLRSWLVATTLTCSMGLAELLLFAVLWNVMSLHGSGMSGWRYYRNSRNHDFLSNKCMSMTRVSSTWRFPIWNRDRWAYLCAGVKSYIPFQQFRMIGGTKFQSQSWKVAHAMSCQYTESCLGQSNAIDSFGIVLPEQAVEMNQV